MIPRKVSLTKPWQSPGLPNPVSPAGPMGKFLYPALLILFLALNVAAYLFIKVELDGSTVTTKRTLAPTTEQER